MKISIIQLILLTAGIFTLILGMWSLKYRSKNGTIPFAGLMFCSAIHSAGYAFELSSVNLHEVLFWSDIQYIGTEFLPVFYLAMSMVYTGNYRRGSRVLLIFMAIFALLTLGVHHTTEEHGLYYRNIILNQSSGLTTIIFTRGPWYILNSAYINLSLLAGSLLYTGFIFKAPGEYRKQASLMLGGTLLPWAGYALYLAGASPYNLDLTPVMLTAASPLWAVALFRYKLLDLAPVARDYIFESMADGMIIIDTRERLVDFNHAAAHVFPCIRKKTVGQEIRRVLSSYPDIIRMLTGEHEKTSLEIKTDADGTVDHYRIQITPLLNKKNSETGKIIALMNTTEETALMAELQQLATTDELTGILNRREFISNAEKEIFRAKRYGRNCTLIMFDLDHFKKINDSYGHSEGDRALKHVVDIVKNNIREIDLFGRFGGEEFTLFLPEVDSDSGVQTAERLRMSINDSEFSVNGVLTNITASFGVSEFSGNFISPEELIKKADEAMYFAKKSGRNKTALYVNDNGFLIAGKQNN